jgi:hypothetical protein
VEEFVEAESTREDKDIWVAGTQGAIAMQSYPC